MNQAFPFAFSLPVIGYFVLYIVTLLLHFVFMHYVLAGGLYVGVGRLVRLMTGTPKPGVNLTDDVTTDWLPFVLSAAITAAIAPLLFVQILYQGAFYTALLLLNHRFMIVLPVLIVAFYLLYALKVRGERLRSGPLRTLIALLAAACFVFVAWSWTENHRLSISESTWPEFYGSGDIVYSDGHILPRFLFWVGIAFPTYALIVIGQIRKRIAMDADRNAPRTIRRLALIAFGGLVFSVAMGAWYTMSIPVEERSAMTSALAMPYIVVAGAAFVTQMIAWGMRIVRPVTTNAAQPLSWSWWFFTGAMTIITLFGLLVVRESIRIQAFGVEQIEANIADSGRLGGFIAFLACFVLAILICGWCVRLAINSNKQVVKVT